MIKITYTNGYGNSLTFDASEPLTLEAIDANSLQITADMQKPVYYDGQRTIATNLNARTVVLDLLVSCGAVDGEYSMQRFRENWLRVQKCFVPSKDAKGVLIYENDSGKYQIECYPFALPNPEYICATTYRVRFEMICDYPYWEDYNEIVVPINETMTPHTINNDSGFPIPFKVRVSGLDYAGIVNMTTGKFLKFIDEIPSGKVLEVDMKNYCVKLYSGDTFEYANYALSADSEYSKLAVGNNIIYVANLSASTASMTAELRYRKQYLGV